MKAYCKMNTIWFHLHSNTSTTDNNYIRLTHPWRRIQAKLSQHLSHLTDPTHSVILITSACLSEWISWAITESNGAQLSRGQNIRKQVQQWLVLWYTICQYKGKVTNCDYVKIVNCIIWCINLTLFMHGATGKGSCRRMFIIYENYGSVHIWRGMEQQMSENQHCICVSINNVSTRVKNYVKDSF